MIKIDAKDIAASIDEHTRKLAGKGPRESMALLVKAGICNRNGSLKKAYMTGEGRRRRRLRAITALRNRGRSKSRQA